MLTVKTPHIYLNEPGIIKRAGEYVEKVGRRPLIIAGKTAFEKVKDGFIPSLVKAGVDSENICIFTGYPSQNQFDKYAEIAKRIDADVIIGIGGGRVIDTAKAAADILGLYVITVPTIAATCAAWAAVTIQYDDEGAYVGGRWNLRSPWLVIADSEIIFSAPVRYLYSGVVDTFAKLYETKPTLEKYPENITMQLAVYGSKIAYDRLEANVEKAVRESEKGIYGNAAKDTIDAIIYLAGFAGSFQEGLTHYGFAHPFYHVSTRLPNTRIKLHGEKVAYGIVAQLFLEKKSEEEIAETIRLFDKYNAAFSLDEIGIRGNLSEDIDFIAKDVKEAFSYVTFDEESIKKALLDADRLTRQVRKGSE